MEAYIQKNFQQNITLEFNQYLKFIETIPENIMIVDPDELSIIYANENFFTLTKYKQDEVFSKSFLNFYIVKNINAFIDQLNQIDQHSSPVTFELVLRGKKNRLFPVELICSMITFLDEEKYLLCYIKDKTYLHRLEVERNMLSHTLKQVNDGLGLFDLEGKIIFVNEAFLDIFGYQNDEIIGRNIEFLFSPFLGYEFQFNILPATLKGGWNGELKAQRKDGQEISVFMSTSTVKDDDDQPVVIVAVLNDITLRKQLEAQLRQSQKMEAIGQLAGGVAHDFNNLLTVIEGYIDLLKKKIDKNHAANNYINCI